MVIGNVRLTGIVHNASVTITMVIGYVRLTVEVAAAVR